MLAVDLDVLSGAIPAVSIETSAKLRKLLLGHNFQILMAPLQWDGIPNLHEAFARWLNRHAAVTCR